VVVTPGGCTQEYFGEEAHYCDPDDLDSIRMAVKAALTSSPNSELRERIARNYHWEAAARRTMEAYQLALERSASRRRDSVGRDVPVLPGAS
jgi:hypothetical protein